VGQVAFAAAKVCCRPDAAAARDLAVWESGSPPSSRVMNTPAAQTMSDENRRCHRDIVFRSAWHPPEYAALAASHHRQLGISTAPSSGRCGTEDTTK